MTTRRAGYTLLITYLTIGLSMQLVSCAWPSLGQDGQPSDIPCAGIPWSFFIVLQWPLLAFFSLSLGDFKPMSITGLVGIVVMVVLIFLLRRFRVSKNNANV